MSEAIEPLNLLNMSSLGEPDSTAIGKHDLLSAISFDHTGNYLSVGDRGGRIIIFEKTTSPQGEDYEYSTEFQSHKSVFDVLNSVDVPQTVTSIEWLNKAPTSKPQLLVSNDK